MVLDALSTRERRGVFAGFIIAVALALIAGYAGASVTGSGYDGETASTDEISTLAESLLDQDISQQEQQFAAMANQSENMSAEDISIEIGEVDVSDSDFPSLYEVTAGVQGDIPTQTGELESIDEEQTLYISKDGRYVFQQPVDIQEQQQQAQQQQTQQAPQQAPEGQSPEGDVQIEE